MMRHDWKVRGGVGRGWFTNGDGEVKGGVGWRGRGGGRGGGGGVRGEMHGAVIELN